MCVNFSVAVTSQQWCHHHKSLCISSQPIPYTTWLRLLRHILKLTEWHCFVTYSLNDPCILADNMTCSINLSRKHSLQRRKMGIAAEVHSRQMTGTTLEGQAEMDLWMFYCMSASSHVTVTTRHYNSTDKMANISER